VKLKPSDDDVEHKDEEKQGEEESSTRGVKSTLRFSIV